MIEQVLQALTAVRNKHGLALKHHIERTERHD